MGKGGKECIQNFDGETSRERPWEDNIKIDFREIGCENGTFLELWVVSSGVFHISGVESLGSATRLHRIELYSENAVVLSWCM